MMEFTLAGVEDWKMTQNGKGEMPALEANAIYMELPKDAEPATVRRGGRMGARIWVVAGTLLVLAACQGPDDPPVQRAAPPTSSQSTPTVPATPAPDDPAVRTSPGETQTVLLTVSVPPAEPTPRTEPEPTRIPEPLPSGFEDTVWVTGSVDEMRAALDQG